MKRQRIISVTGSVLLVCAFAFMSIASSSTKNNGGDTNQSDSVETTQGTTKSDTTDSDTKNTESNESDTPAETEDTTGATEKDDLSNAFGKTVVFDDLEITFGSKIKWVKLKNQFSEYNNKKVIELPIHVKNISDKKNHLNIFYVKVFGSKGTELDELGAYFEKKGIFYCGDLRPGAEKDLAIYFPHDGDGTYYVEFDKWSNEIEAGFEIKK